jgi:hypothetical protein
MNDKIENLLTELGWGMGDPSDDCMQCSPFDPYEFAKRIIQECAKVADDNFNKGFCPVGDYIKQHFGVE